MIYDEEQLGSTATDLFAFTPGAGITSTANAARRHVVAQGQGPDVCTALVDASSEV